MLATCICLSGSLLDQLCCTIVNLFAVYLYRFGQINMSVCLSVCLSVSLSLFWPIDECGYSMPNQAGGQSLCNSRLLAMVGQPNSSGVFVLNQFIHRGVIS